MKSAKIPTFEEIFTMENLLKAHFLCRKGKQHKKEVINFEINLFSNLTRLHDSLMNGTYSIPKYRAFYVKEPKLRLIESLPYKHRLVQRVLCENLFKPVFEKHFIYDNCACREGKGTLFALDRLKKFMIDFCKKNKNGWFVVCDIKKYFENIDHEILLKKLRYFDFDQKTFQLIEKYVNSNGKSKGLPIGNQVSQWFGLMYLDSFDKFAKSALKQRCYIRYMDDFVMLFASEEQISETLEKVKHKLGEDGLLLKENLRIGQLKCGVPFLGFLSYCSTSFYRRAQKTPLQRMKANLRLISILEENKFYDNKFFFERKNCYAAHLVHANEHFFVERLLMVP